MKQPPQEGIGRKEKADLWVWGKRRVGKKVNSIVDERGFRGGGLLYCYINERKREEFFCFCLFFLCMLFLHGFVFVWKVGF